jgi:hypothetical protein
MKYFGPDKDWRYNSRIPAVGNKWFKYGEGYKMMCEFAEQQILEKDRSNQDFLLFPYCYCIRHYIEISLKEIIDEGSRLYGKPADPTDGGHNLCIILNKSLEILSKLEGTEVTIPSDVSNFINELHSIDTKSDNFRYPINKRGNDTLKNITTINFRKVADGFSKVKTYLEGITSLIAEARSNFYDLKT